MAGSQHVLELHGTVHKNTCMKCHKKYSLEELYEGHICSCGGVIKPDVVLYEEPLPNGVFESAIKAISKCDTFIVGGTSLAVYPANSLIYYFYGDNIVLINNDDQIINRKIKLFIKGKVGEIFKKLY